MPEKVTLSIEHCKEIIMILSQQRRYITNRKDQGRITSFIDHVLKAPDDPEKGWNKCKFSDSCKSTGCQFKHPDGREAKK